MANTTNFNWETPDDTDLVKDGAAAIRTLGNSIDTSFVDLKGGTTGQVLSKASNTDLDFTWTAGGDITEVQAGTGISIASGTGPIPVVTNTVATAFDAAGDLVYGTGADTFTKLGIGTANQVLRVNSGATAPEWATLGAAGMSLVTRQTITGSSGTNIDSIFTSTYNTYLIVLENTSGSVTSSEFRLQLRYGTTTLTSALYRERGMLIDASYTKVDADRAHILLTPSIGASNQGNSGHLFISRVGNTSEKAMAWGHIHNSSSGTPIIISNYINDSQTYTGIRLTTASGTFDATIAIYGLAKS
jgi:hypothetical protein